MLALYCYWNAYPVTYYLILFKAYLLLSAHIAQPINYSWLIILLVLLAMFARQPIPVLKYVGLVMSYDTRPFFIGERKGEAFHFQFVNGFGLLELISCYARSALEYAISTEENTRVVERTFSSINSAFTAKTKPKVTYNLSSGYNKRLYVHCPS